MKDERIMLNALVKSEEIRVTKSQTVQKDGTIVTREILVHPVRYLNHEQQDQAFKESQAAATNLWAATMARVVDMFPSVEPSKNFEAAQAVAKSISKAVRKTLPTDGPNTNTLGQYVSVASMFCALFGTQMAITSHSPDGKPSTLVPRTQAQMDNASARPERLETAEESYRRAMGAVKGHLGVTLSLSKLAPTNDELPRIITLFQQSADLLGCRVNVDQWLRANMTRDDSKVSEETDEQTDQAAA